MHCSLCFSEDVSIFANREDLRFGKRDYYQCGQCDLIFMPEKQHFSLSEEKERYDAHNNDPNDDRYLDFLGRLADVMIERISPNSTGLDFGCGPGPAMHKIFEEHGHVLKEYDPFYAKNDIFLKQNYDFITCSETAEHFCQPRKEFELLVSMLNPGGHLGVMTYMYGEGIDFNSWWYPRDLTHVSFYSVSTFKWIAQWKNLFLENPADNVVVFKK